LQGCGQDEPAQIDWQLPLAASGDPHGDSVNQNIPDWAASAQGSIELVLLQKNTARRFTLPLVIGADASFQDMHFRLLGLAEGLQLKSGSYINDKNVHNPAAFVEIIRSNRQIYRGWLYQDFPELFGPDMADWKLWLDKVVIKEAVESNTSGNADFDSATAGTNRTGTNGTDTNGTNKSKTGLDKNMRP